MPSPAPKRFTLLAALRRFRGSRRGSAAVEFALVAPVFFALLFAIIESALMFFASQVLETVAQNSARVLLTGQAQSGSVTACAVSGVSTPCSQTTFKTYVCNQIPALFDCAKLYVDVVSTNTFGSLSLTSYGNSCSFNPTGVQYSAGAAGPGRRGAAVLSVAALRHRPRLQHGLQQQAAAGGDRGLQE
ncbi:Flp pilus assembly protein TadG [Bradyrhizobium sp. LM6.11]